MTSQSQSHPTSPSNNPVAGENPESLSETQNTVNTDVSNSAPTSQPTPELSDHALIELLDPDGSLGLLDELLPPDEPQPELLIEPASTPTLHDGKSHGEDETSDLVEDGADTDVVSNETEGIDSFDGDEPQLPPENDDNKGTGEAPSDNDVQKGASSLTDRLSAWRESIELGEHEAQSMEDETQELMTNWKMRPVSELRQVWLNTLDHGSQTLLDGKSIYAMDADEFSSKLQEVQSQGRIAEANQLQQLYVNAMHGFQHLLAQENLAQQQVNIFKQQQAQDTWEQVEEQWIHAFPELGNYSDDIRAHIEQHLDLPWVRHQLTQRGEQGCHYLIHKAIHQLKILDKIQANLKDSSQTQGPSPSENSTPTDKQGVPQNQSNSESSTHDSPTTLQAASAIPTPFPSVQLPDAGAGRRKVVGNPLNSLPYEVSDIASMSQAQFNRLPDHIIDEYLSL